MRWCSCNKEIISIDLAAKVTLEACAAEVEKNHPLLAKDLRERYGLVSPLTRTLEALEKLTTALDNAFICNMQAVSWREELEAAQTLLAELKGPG